MSPRPPSFTDPAARSEEATATIQIERGGLLWQLQTNASSALSDEAAGSEGAATSAVGATAPDFLFKLDWQYRSPRKAVRVDASELMSLPAPPEGAQDLRKNRHATGHLRLTTGFATRPLATSQDQVVEDDGAAPTVGGTAMIMKVTNQQVFTVGADFNYGLSSDVDGQGTFGEWGVVGRAHFDTFIDPGDSVTENGVTFVNVRSLNGEKGFFRYEAGFRASFKQFDADTTHGLVGTQANSDHADNAFLQPSNGVDLFVFEALLQRQNALSDLTEMMGGSRNRWAFRFLAMPPLPGASGNARFLIGVEASRDLDNKGPQDIRIFYGVDASLDRLF